LGKLIVQDNYRSIRAIAHIFMKSHQVSENTQKVPEDELPISEISD
jgi:hypothetical protein